MELKYTAELYMCVCVYYQKSFRAEGLHVLFVTWFTRFTGKENTT